MLSAHSRADLSHSHQHSKHHWVGQISVRPDLTILQVHAAHARWSLLDTCSSLRPWTKRKEKWMGLCFNANNKRLSEVDGWWTSGEGIEPEWFASKCARAWELLNTLPVSRGVNLIHGHVPWKHRPEFFSIFSVRNDFIYSVISFYPSRVLL